MPEGAPGPKIAATDPNGADAGWCLARYCEELRARFPGGFEPAKSVVAEPDVFQPPTGMFLIAWQEGRPVGCGAVKLTSEGVGYIKRMWVDSSRRGEGLGRRMLAALEDAAAELGCRTVQLETHRALEEAIHLYRTAGYREVPPFNDEHYAHHWFQKELPTRSGPGRSMTMDVDGPDPP